MADYTNKPPITNIPFSFGSSGYSPPDFKAITFDYSTRPSYSQTADLRSAISVLQLYQDSTYNYIKSCKTIVVGYSGSTIQTLHLPCEYGGIRDVGASIYGNPLHKDLGSYIFALAWFKDLTSYIKSLTRQTKNLYTYLNAFGTGLTDLVNAIKVLHSNTFDLSSTLEGFKGIEITNDIPSYIYSIPPVDLQAILNVIELRDLPSSITGEWWKGIANLPSSIPSTSLRSFVSISSTLSGWAAKDLGSIIQPNVNFDLTSLINGGMFAIHKDLSTYLNAVAPALLNSTIHGFATTDLVASLIGGFGPGDIQSYINAVSPSDLKSRIYAYKGVGVVYDLASIISGYNTSDLTASIWPNSPVDLGAYIKSIGKSLDLGASIIPMTILMSTVFKVSLLEYKNLPSLINYGCRQSDYKDLNSYTYALMCKDLRSMLIGWHGDYAKNVRDLKSYINVQTALTVNTLSINFNVAPEYSEFDLNFTRPSHYYKVVDSARVGFSTGEYKILSSYIYGLPRHVDLSAYINSQIQTNFTTAPEWINPKTTEVFINLRRFEERWSRFVDLLFSTGTEGENYYFYVSGDEQIYKVNRNQRWTLWVTGYDRVQNNLREKSNVRRKFVFNLKDYTSMDQAIRDMMDRVAEFRRTDLNVSINGIFPPHYDLISTLNSVTKYTWSKNLSSTITPS